MQKEIMREYQCLSAIIEPLLTIFTNPRVNINTQLVGLASCAHLMLFVYRKHKSKFMTLALFLDIQSTIQDAFNAARRFNVKGTIYKLFLFMLGTDQMEELFGNIRTMTHSANCDYLQLIQKLRIAM